MESISTRLNPDNPKNPRLQKKYEEIFEKESEKIQKLIEQCTDDREQKEEFSEYYKTGTKHYALPDGQHVYTTRGLYFITNGKSDFAIENMHKLQMSESHLKSLIGPNGVGTFYLPGKSIIHMLRDDYREIFVGNVEFDKTTGEYLASTSYRGGDAKKIDGTFEGEMLIDEMKERFGRRLPIANRKEQQEGLIMLNDFCDMLGLDDRKIPEGDFEKIMKEEELHLKFDREAGLKERIRYLEQGHDRLNEEIEKLREENSKLKEEQSVLSKANQKLENENRNLKDSLHRVKAFLMEKCVNIPILGKKILEGMNEALESANKPKEERKDDSNVR